MSQMISKTFNPSVSIVGEATLFSRISILLPAKTHPPQKSKHTQERWKKLRWQPQLYNKALSPFIWVMMHVNKGHIFNHVVITAILTFWTSPCICFWAILHPNSLILCSKKGKVMDIFCTRISSRNEIRTDLLTPLICVFLRTDSITDEERMNFSFPLLTSPFDSHYNK